MTKTYSEVQRGILFKAARDLRKLACEVLNDVSDQEIVSLATFTWAKGWAARYAIQANTLENEGYEIGTYLDGRTAGYQARSRREYSKAVDNFQNRAAEEGLLAQVNAYLAEYPKIGS